MEIPLVAKRLADVGPLRRGDLPRRRDSRRNDARPAHQPRREHWRSREIALDANVPVLFGVLTCETMEQAIHRAGGNVGNKGAECAEAALQMVGLLKNIP